MPVTVEVFAHDDAIDEAQELWHVLHEARSKDMLYNTSDLLFWPHRALEVLVVDNSVVTVSASLVSVREDYTDGDDFHAWYVDRSSLTFTHGDWFVPHDIRVFALEDDFHEGLHSASLHVTAHSLDLDYASPLFDPGHETSYQKVTVLVTDNDEASVLVSLLELDMFEGGSGSSQLAWLGVAESNSHDSNFAPPYTAYILAY